MVSGALPSTAVRLLGAGRQLRARLIYRDYRRASSKRRARRRAGRRAGRAGRR